MAIVVPVNILWEVGSGNWVVDGFQFPLPTSQSQALGDGSEGVPPVPIPNTEVKPFSPDGTARASVWESRTLPD